MRGREVFGRSGIWYGLGSESYKEIIKIGYRIAQQAIETWQRDQKVGMWLYSVTYRLCLLYNAQH